MFDGDYGMYRYLYEEGLEERNNLPYSCSYRDALKYRNISIVLCNNIPDIDEEILIRYEDSYEPEFQETAYYYKEKCDESDYWADYVPDIFQWYVTDATEDDVKFLNKHFSDFYFVYSDVLDNFVLAVNHWGTKWDFVSVRTDIKDIHDVKALEEIIKKETV